MKKILALGIILFKLYFGYYGVADDKITSYYASISHVRKIEIDS